MLSYVKLYIIIIIIIINIHVELLHILEEQTSKKTPL